jgi:hypothetical protein
VVLARRGFVKLIIAMSVLIVALGIVAGVMLARPGHLPDGVVCTAVVGTASASPSTACNAWRHHQLMLFLWPAVLVGTAIVIVVLLQVRAIRAIARAERPVSPT